MQVFLDEVNTSSCVGLFKEIIVDKTFDGEVIKAGTSPYVHMECPLHAYT